MKRRIAIIIFSTILYSICLAPADGEQGNRYPWMQGETIPEASVVERIAPPDGYERVVVAPNTFADWLRHLPLKPEGSPVLLHTGEEKINQSAHAAVIDIDVGARDLQQCADAVIRLRAEYLYSRELFDKIRFHFTSGDPAPYVQWRSGLRPEVAGNSVRWVMRADPDLSYASFRRYLDTVFIYAGTYSLSRELRLRDRTDEMRPGDVFIRGGFPGHAVIVIDMARNDISGEMAFLLAQSYMPAQSIHILVNPTNPAFSPWYPVQFGDVLKTPEWDFARTELRYFPDDGYRR